MRRSTTGAGVAVLLALVASACAPQGAPPGASTGPGGATPTRGSSSASASPSGAEPTASAGTGAPLDLEQFTPAPAGVVDEDTGETVVPQVVATWDARSRAAVVAAAVTATTAFARPGVPFDAWWAELSPLLTQRAQQDYAFVDPANVPATAVTGPGVLVDETSAYVAGVQVPTDVGPYTVLLTRVDGAAPWLVSRLTPPDGIG